ncbi:hypothetical protein DE4585_03055 [Mycobacteroides salmoniphilum]|uniref:Uncharacterized protein n=1 Tax=Mycobacteroides salmoniphilum TaxID=404941 RepID=A0A4R8RXK4_9MYCO|nr:DUF2017 domain-containing protein [Mycobacteroides salmoniphilum]TDZ79316.1 hypothetical protein DE4585_03055 [Mycobacteroides salmoniphilum]
MRKWKRVNAPDGTRLRSEMEPHEAALVQSMVTSMLAMLDERESSAPSDELAQLTGIRTGNSEAPTDVTLGRLLPDFHRPDQDGTSSIEAVSGLNSALRSLYEPEIIDTKREAGQRLLRTLPPEGGRFELSEDDARAWLTALNDVRLALGAMLGIDRDGPQELPADDPMAGHMDIYHWLTVMQELLVLALMGKSAV